MRLFPIPSAAFAAAVVMLYGSTSDAPASDPAAAVELAGKLPAGANALSVVRASELLASPRARAEGWEDRARDRFVSGATVLPKWAEVVVTGAEVRPSGGPAWYAALFTGPETIGLAALAPGGRDDVGELAGRPAFGNRGRSLVAEIAPGTFAAFNPPDREKAAEWLRAIADGEPNGLSPFLRDAAARPAGMTLALDVAGALPADRTAQFVATVPGLSVGAADADGPLVPLLVGARGIIVTVDVGREIAMTVRAEFSSPVGEQADAVRAVLLEAIAADGLALPELDAAEFAAEGDALVGRANLSTESFAFLVTLLHPDPVPDHFEGDAETPDAAPATDDQAASTAAAAGAAATAEFGREVVATVNRMRAWNARSTTPERSVRYLEGQIDHLRRLPTRGVDPAVAGRAEQIVEFLNALVASLSGQAVTVDRLNGAVRWERRVDPGRIGYSWWVGPLVTLPTSRVDTNLGEVRRLQAAAIAAGLQQRQQIWQLVETRRQEIERAVKRLPQR